MCGDCSNRLLVPLSDAVIYDHLAGKQTIGVYPLLEDDSCCFLAVDFDKADCHDDARVFMQSCEELGVQAALEISRSGNGAHAWVFFASRVAARDAQRFGTAIISHTCARTRQLMLASYDRLFPNQDTMPKGGFGNLIALPLQKGPREKGFSVFVDPDVRPYHDQWAFLASIQPVAVQDIEPTILRATGGAHPLDVAFIDDEDLATPWKRQSTSTKKLAGQMPKSLTVTLANLIYFEKDQLPQALANRLMVLVHRTELLKQWQERLQAFLGVGKGVIGTIGGGKAKPTGKIDIAVMQSVSRQGEVIPLVENYGLVIVDECHHVGAVSFDAILKRAKAKYVLGLTATPIRRDGQQPIIFMQCGPIRFTAAKPAGAPHDLKVQPHSRFTRIDLPIDAAIQDVFRHLANDHARTEAIAAEVRGAVGQGRKVLVLTERTEHLDAINAALNGLEPAPFVLHGRMSRKQRAALVANLDALPPDAPRVLLSTGTLVGEGFDHPPLDTLVLAMPVSWKGTLQQYAGRLHREHASKTDVRIIDFVDTGHAIRCLVFHVCNSCDKSHHRCDNAAV
jgi:hypothetical protein